MDVAKLWFFCVTGIWYGLSSVVPQWVREPDRGMATLTIGCLCAFAVSHVVRDMDAKDGGAR